MTRTIQPGDECDHCGEPLDPEDSKDACFWCGAPLSDIAPPQDLGEAQIGHPVTDKARLIAAAQDLLEALRLMVDTWEGRPRLLTGNIVQQQEMALAQGKSAIAKARGEA